MAGLRPRERARLVGVDALRDEELLALLIGSGSRGEQAVDAGRRDGRVRRAFTLWAEVACSGWRPSGASALPAPCHRRGVELGRRRMDRPDSPAMRVTRSEDIVRRFRSRLIDRSEEEFWALALNRANGALADLRISIGGQSGTVVDPKVVFSKALLVRASALVLVHNHPSGNPRPSESDKRLTRSLVEAGRALDLPVLVRHHRRDAPL